MGTLSDLEIGRISQEYRGTFKEFVNFLVENFRIFEILLMVVYLIYITEAFDQLLHSTS